MNKDDFIASGYRSPTASGTKDSISEISDSFRETENAPTFSSSRLIDVVPGIGTTSNPLAITQARASCAGVHPFLAAKS